jgi:ATP-binding cassette subfamily B protein
MFIASCAEILTIGAIFPFLGILISPQEISKFHLFYEFTSWFGLTQADQILKFVAIFFAVAVIFSTGIRIFLLWFQTKLSHAIGSDLSIDIYRRTLHQAYLVHLSRNSSIIISGIRSGVNNVVGGIIIPVMNITSASIMVAGVMAALLFIQPIVALTVLLGFGGIYLSVILVTRKMLFSDGKKINKESAKVIKALQEGLGGIRDILLDRSQEVYCEVYRASDLSLRQAEARIAIISGSPRYVVEGISIIFIIGLAYLLSTASGGVVATIPALGALALCAQRLLPIMQQAYQGVSSIKGTQFSLRDTLHLLAQQIPRNDNVLTLAQPFDNEIELQNISFRYEKNLSFVVKNLNIKIKKGECVGFIGSTGGGKSTLIDIIMALIKPTSGKLLIDGIEIAEHNSSLWQKHIAHVPQSIFLSDATLAENIAFCIPLSKIDMDRVRLAAKRAQISSLIESWELKYETLVGERGVRLSGGQRQRIGIARALYKNADVIIFDEATSALDNETELAVIEAIDSLSSEITVLMVAHRLTTLKKCSKIYELGGGGIIRQGSYEDIIKAN